MFSPGTMEDIVGALSGAFYSSIEVGCMVELMREKVKTDGHLDVRNVFAHGKLPQRRMAL